MGGEFVLGIIHSWDWRGGRKGRVKKIGTGLKTSWEKGGGERTEEVGAVEGAVEGVGGACQQETNPLHYPSPSTKTRRRGEEGERE